MKPSQLYERDLNSGKTKDDPAQRNVLAVFDQLYLALQAKPRVLNDLWPFAKKSALKSVYIYGEVGRGKTYLMDLFFASLTVPKLRLHFYEFMIKIHVELKMLQGTVNPLNQVVEKLAKGAKVFCLDEFFIEDIADAMILASLLDGLIKAGVVIVTTSNVDPQELYKEGLQRDRFLPAIQLIQQHFQILNLLHPSDYRLLHDFEHKNFHAPLTHQEDFLEFHFQGFQGDHSLEPNQFKIKTRSFESVRRSKKAIWFDFSALCEKPRAAADYLALFKLYPVMLIQNIPILTEQNNDAARRFITLVDTAYDRQVPLILSAEAPLAELYQGKRLAFEFERTKSRLTEMAGWI